MPYIAPGRRWAVENHLGHFGIVIPTEDGTGCMITTPCDGHPPSSHVAAIENWLTKPGAINNPLAPASLLFAAGQVNASAKALQQKPTITIAPRRGMAFPVLGGYAALGRSRRLNWRVTRNPGRNGQDFLALAVPIIRRVARLLGTFERI